MAEKKTLTPEEKLLNVIQGKEESKKPAAETAKGASERQSLAVPNPAPVSAPKVAPTSAPAPAAPPAARPTGEPMKFAPAAQASSSSPRPAPAPAAVPVSSSEQSVGKGEAGRPEVPQKPAQAARTNMKAAGADKMDVRSRTLATVNRILRIVIVAIVGLCIWEIWANCSTGAMPANLQVGRNTGGATPSAVSSEPCSGMLASFEGKTLFSPVSAEPDPTPSSNPKPSISEVQQYVTRNLNLIGVSPGKDGAIVEAILADTQTKRTHFLKVGDKITMKTWAIELKQIAADSAVFLCGKEEIQVQ